MSAAIGAQHVVLLQGSFTSAVSASSGTHSGGGAADLAFTGPKVLRTLKAHGWAAWYRPELWQNGRKLWGAHIHAVLMDNPLLSGAARAQVQSYRLNRNGLASDGPDPSWRPVPQPLWRWQEMKLWIPKS